MPAEDVIDRAVEAVADGARVDWDLLESGASSDEERDRLKCIRILGQIADLHRSTDGDSFDQDAESPAERVVEPRLAPEQATEVWGGYRLGEKVGEGSFGGVYRALDPQLEREIAIKILHRRVADDRLRAQLLREGRALARIRHPNVVTVFGVESHGDRVGLCMEFVPGQTLEQILRTSGAFTPRDAASIGADVCRALAAVHQAGFVHRDVKARNVMREEDGRIVLMDFGTGREANQQNPAARGDLAGTPLYMAPEVLAGEPASARSDVYSVGVLVFHLVTTDYPVLAYSVDDLRVAHAQARRRPLDKVRPDLPAGFVRVVERALAPVPDDRYASSTAMLHALTAVFADRWTARAVAKRLLAFVLSLVVAAGIATALGWLSSRTFNAALDRSDFVNEQFRDWMVLGMRSSVLAIALLTLASLTTAVGLVVRRLVIGVSSGARRADAAVRAWFVRASYRLRLHDLSVLGSWILLLSMAALVWAWWTFWPMLDAASASISTAPADVLAQLAPSNRTHHEHYRLTFGGLGIAMVAAWMLAFRLAGRRGQTLSRGLLAGGAATIVLTFATFALPYRLIVDDNKFKAVMWRNTTCYLVGERAEDVLLFCPALSPPRARVVHKSEETVERLDTSENIFTSFAPVASGSQ